MSNDIFQAVERVFGLSESVQKDILKQVKSNRDVLNSCDYHDFSIDLTPDIAFGKKWKCSNCGGEVNAQEKSWYEKGIEHSNRRMNLNEYENRKNQKTDAFLDKP